MQLLEGCVHIVGGTLEELLLVHWVAHVVLALEVALDEGLDSIGQVLLDVLTDVVAMRSMAIAHREEVHAELAKHVGVEDVGILVSLPWIARLVATGCGKGELGDDVESSSFGGSLLSLLLEDVGVEAERFIFVPLRYLLFSVLFLMVC